MQKKKVERMKRHFDLKFECVIKSKLKYLIQSLIKEVKLLFWFGGG